MAKTRAGFVSNSSASSFIVAVSPLCDPRFMERFHQGHYDYEANEIFSRGYDDAIRDIEQQDRGWQNATRNPMSAMNSLRNEGWEIVHLRISYHDHETLDMLDDEVGRGHIERLFNGD